MYASSSTESLTDVSLPEMKVIALIDVDSFECQVWQRMEHHQRFRGLPCVVADLGGRIVSVTYEAKALGITRDMRVQQAMRVAEGQLNIFWKPNDGNKPDGKPTRYASWEIVDALKRYAEKREDSIIIESGGSDEFYLDLTEEVNLRLDNREMFELNFEDRTFLEEEYYKLKGLKLDHYADTNYRNIDSDLQKIEEQKLIYGGAIMQEINSYILKTTSFVASVGVGTNKLIAKIAVNLNKPNGITIVTPAALSRVSKAIPIEKITGLGGKLGTEIKKKLKIKTMGDLRKVELEDLAEAIGEEKAWEIHLKCYGISDEPVTEKIMSAEVSCGKNFQKREINSESKFKDNIRFLCEEMFNLRLREELDRHKRQPSCVRAHVLYTKLEDKKMKPAEPEMKVDATSTTEEQIKGDESGSWSCIIEDLIEKTCADVLKEIIERFKEDVNKPIKSLRISRICLTARGFKSV